MLIFLMGSTNTEEDRQTLSEIAHKLEERGHAVIIPKRQKEPRNPGALRRVVCRSKHPSFDGRGPDPFALDRDIPILYSYEPIPDLHPTEIKSPKQVHGFIDVIMRMYRTHLDKNADYSPANILGTGEIGLVTRTWDKMARLMNLMGFRITINESEFAEPTNPKNESVADNLLDLAVYTVIWILHRGRVWGR